MREQLLPDSKIAPHTRRSIPILRGLAYLSAYGVKPARDDLWSGGPFYGYNSNIILDYVTDL